MFSDDDAERVCKFLGISEAEFMTKYKWDGAGIDITGGVCPFYDREKQCTIQAAKPKVCREFPRPDVDVEKFARICPGLKPIRKADDSTRKISQGKNPED